MKAVATALVTLSTLLFWHPAAHPLPARTPPLTANMWSSINLDDDGVFAVVEQAESHNRAHSTPVLPSVLPADVPADARLAWFDFDGDGDLDLFAITSTGVLQVWRNDGLGHLSSVRPTTGGHATARWTTSGQQFESPRMVSQNRCPAIIAQASALTPWTRAGPPHRVVTHGSLHAVFRSGSPRSPPLSASA